MRVIGITGGVGSGKTKIISYLRDYYHMDFASADNISKELIRPGAACYDKMIRALGNDILNEDGTINKQAVANKIFSDKSALHSVNGIIHPEVKKIILSQITKAHERGAEYFGIEAALLLDDGYDKICDELWYVYSSENTRYRRLSEERGYSIEKTRSIMNRQKSDKEFRIACTYTIDNSGNFNETMRQIDALLGRKE